MSRTIQNYTKPLTVPEGTLKVKAIIAKQRLCMKTTISNIYKTRKNYHLDQDFFWKALTKFFKTYKIKNSWTPVHFLWVVQFLATFNL